MLSLKDAYYLFKKEHPEVTSKTMHDLGSYYFIEGCTAEPGGFDSLMYKVDKETGKIEELDLIDYINDFPKDKEEDEIPSYTEE